MFVYVACLWPWIVNQFRLNFFLIWIWPYQPPPTPPHLQRKKKDKEQEKVCKLTQCEKSLRFCLCFVCFGFVCLFVLFENGKLVCL